MTDKIINQAIRRRKAQERIGTQNPKCSICSETNPLCFEEHHIARRRYDGTTITLCKNCHAKASDMQSDHPKFLAGEPTQQESFGRMLLGLADLLALVIQKLIAIGEWLIKEAKLSGGNKNPQQT
jgi:hypothetical protein